MLGEPGFRLAEGVVSGGGEGGHRAASWWTLCRPCLDAVQAMAGDVVERVGAVATAFDVGEVDLLAGPLQGTGTAGGCSRWENIGQGLDGRDRRRPRAAHIGTMAPLILTAVVPSVGHDTLN